VVTFKTIVCAIDFSATSHHALDYALSLAQEAGGQLVLIHALEGFSLEPSASFTQFEVTDLHRTLAHEAQQRLEALVPEGARTWCAPEVIVGYGKAYREVLRVADERRADLIVLGVHGHGGFDLALFGSTTQHVVRAATCPVMTVGERAGS
jgi:nucleotide-binding universal stress UspA family protein